MVAIRFKPGLLLRVPLDDGMHTYGRMLARKPYMAFHDFRTREETPDPVEVAKSPVLFVVVTSAASVKEEGWDPLGVVPLDEVDTPIPPSFRQDPDNPKDLKIVDALGNERVATVEECLGLENWGVGWHADHIQDRLNDHYAGRENIWVEQVRLKIP